ncbi:MAG TPA: gliding motility-associated C-terminal domain-containing protein [Bacteroidia bacterium]|nr:gliding motility-associated C-terminal domain-containing protein [Bacteroidia bacterium]HRG51465.1 gliding motility-associated C-terminal domain-containing protein [Bacteroidia bacterium]
MRHYLLYTFFSFLSITLVAQDNLVPNTSFENEVACPTVADQLSATTNWYSGNAESPDYFHTCQLVTGTYGIPYTVYGYQLARTGEAFTGLHVYGGPPTSKREYLQVELSSDLSEGTDYLISFYVNLANSSSVAISRFGVYLSTNAQIDTAGGPFPFAPQLSTDSTIFYSDTAKWVKISAYYTATGGERFMTIGNFNSDLATDTLQINTLSTLSYYFIEDVSVIQSDSSSETPNIFTPNNDGINDDWVIRNLSKNSLIKIYDRWGIPVGGIEGPGGIEGTYKWDGRTTSGERCKEGVYFYIVTGEKNRKGFIYLMR